MLLMPDFIGLEQDNREWHVIKFNLRKGCQIETISKLLKFRPSSEVVYPQVFSLYLSNFWLDYATFILLESN